MRTYKRWRVSQNGQACPFNPTELVGLSDVTNVGNLAVFWVLGWRVKRPAGWRSPQKPRFLQTDLDLNFQFRQ
jgi:hypothetical protein